VLKHEEPQHQEFVELCALAMVGEASGDELSNLRAHLRECEDCRREYREFTQLVLPQLQAMDDGAAPGNAATRGEVSDADAARLRASFLERAQSEGIQFSAKTLHGAQKPPKPAAALSRRPVWYAVAGIAAGLVLGAVLVSRYPLGDFAQGPVAHGPTSATAELGLKAASAVEGAAPQHAPDPAVAEVARLELRQRDLLSTLSDLRTQLANADAERTALRQQLANETNALAQAQTDAGASQQTVATLRSDLSALEARADLNAATYRDAQAKVQELTAQVAQADGALTQARETLTASHEVGNLMAERNLHIVDVYDTDGQGKTKPVFGRIFLTGNKKLLFYAYDLNRSHLENTKYTYRVWGEKLGPGQTAKALGAFHSDDEAQRRWAFEYDDPKVLADIDSVFVTSESAAKESDHPHGPKLMYAYLRGEANHP
jgi:hypothetical protein